MMLTNTTEHEKENLEAHVDLCAIRYQNLDNRLTKVEERLEQLHTAVKQNNSTTMKALIGAVATIIVALIGAVATILSSMPIR